MFHIRCVVLGYALALSLWAGVETAAAPLGTAFTYQGQLKQGDAPVTTKSAMTLQLFDASIAGASVGSLLPFPAVSVVNGLFTVDQDFGAVQVRRFERRTRGSTPLDHRFPS